MLDITKAKLNIDCPKCKSKNFFTLSQAKNAEKIVCRGCGIKIVFSDNGSVEKVQASINNSLSQLSNKIKKMNEKF